MKKEILSIKTILKCVRGKVNSETKILIKKTKQNERDKDGITRVDKN